MPRSFIAGAAFQAALLCGLSVMCAAQTRFNTNPTQFLVCDKGIGSFEGKLPNFSVPSGVTVSVRATKKGDFATHGCDAKLTWSHGETILGSNLAQADIDVMGADLGFGVPVVAFQIKVTDADPTIRYEIYSLSKPPKLLHTITGQDYFSAADTRLDGTVEIWTTDSAPINGFDGLPLRAFDMPPTTVLRFEDGKLIDVSSEFRSHFNRQIDTLRSHLSNRQLSNFLASDGRLSGEHLSSQDEPTGLLATKIKVLEIVWAYLYSGREQQAWEALDKMWPASDIDRVRTAMTTAMKHGLRNQVDGVSQLTEPPGHAGSSRLYANTASFGYYGMPAWERAEVADSGPQQILLRLPSPSNPEDWDEEKNVELVIDEAGKVRSARMANGMVKDISAGVGDEPNKEWIDLAVGWKYIPAFKDGHPKAFRSKLHVLRDR
jgi:hypothetical protein